MDNNGENNENIEAQVVPNAEIAGGENNQESQENQEITLPSFNDQLITWAKENGREVADVNELLKPVEVEKEVIKEINPWADVADDDDKAYFEVKKNHPTISRKEFESLSVNVDELDPLDVAREQARRDIGVSALSPEMADQHIADKLGIDLDDLTDYDKVKLLGYGKTIRDEKKSQQEQYRTKPVEDNPATQQQSAQQEYITLPNGAVMRKADFEAAESAQQKEIESAVQAVKTVTAAKFKMSVDDNGSVKDVEIPYDYSDDDRQNMVSMVSDVSGFISKTFGSESGFNQAAFGEGMLWSNPEFRQKAIAAMAQKIDAQATERTMKLIGNHNFDPNKPIDKQTKEGVRFVPFNQLGR